MLLYLYGADSFRRTRALNEQILPAYLKKHGEATIERFDGAEKNLAEKLAEFIQNVSLFTTLKLAVLTSPGELDTETRKLVKGLRENTATTLVIVSEKKLPKKDFGFLSDEAVKSWEYDPLKGRAWLAFIEQEAKRLCLTLSEKELRDLAKIYEGDSWGVVTELEKISLGGAVEIAETTTDFFTLVKSLRNGRGVRDRLVPLALLLENEGGMAAFNMLARFTEGSSRRKMADYDIGLRSGGLEAPEALLDLILDG